MNYASKLAVKNEHNDLKRTKIDRSDLSNKRGSIIMCRVIRGKRRQKLEKNNIILLPDHREGSHIEQQQQ